MAEQPHRLGAVIGVGNQKGGVGKSTNTVNLAAALGEEGYLCLVIDTDPGAGSTDHLGIPRKSFAGSLELMTDPEEDPLDLIVREETLPRNVHLIPSRTQLAELDQNLPKFVERTQLLKRPLAKLKPHYDFIFIDTPPDPAATQTIATYCAVDWFLLSSLPQFLSVKGLSHALEDIRDVRASQNPDLEILGLVFSGVDARTKAVKEVEELEAKFFPERSFGTTISQAIAVAKLPERGITVFQSAKLRKHKVADQYRDIARQIVERVTHREEFINGRLDTRPEAYLRELERISKEAPAADEPEVDETEPQVVNE